ncbi:hypothetical protein BBP40_008854 [Aspergillus hancockii]|nr:hypothetical protein BBP40_008854 [Aspergillus hancockii]
MADDKLKSAEKLWNELTKVEESAAPNYELMLLKIEFEMATELLLERKVVDKSQILLPIIFDADLRHDYRLLTQARVLLLIGDPVCRGSWRDLYTTLEFLLEDSGNKVEYIQTWDLFASWTFSTKAPGPRGLGESPLAPVSCNLLMSDHGPHQAPDARWINLLGQGYRMFNIFDWSGGDSQKRTRFDIPLYSWRYYSYQRHIPQIFSNGNVPSDLPVFQPREDHQQTIDVIAYLLDIDVSALQLKARQKVGQEVKSAFNWGTFPHGNETLISAKRGKQRITSSNSFESPKDDRPFQKPQPSHFPIQSSSESAYDRKPSLGKLYQEAWGFFLPNGEPPPILLRKKLDHDGDMSAGKNAQSNPEIQHQTKALEGTDKLEPGGIVFGRNHTCDIILPTASEQQFLVFPFFRKGRLITYLSDLSTTGTFVNGAILGCNKHHVLEDGDVISIEDGESFLFRYPIVRDRQSFHQRYEKCGQLGKGHFATVYLCVERTTSIRYAAKLFERLLDSKQTEIDNLVSEIALSNRINHPNLLHLKETFEESEGLYLIHELAPEGELFNYIVLKQKLSEDEARHIFRQLFEAVQYLHDLGFVHRDIKPENILIVDKDLLVKLGDFGLTKFIGEEDFAHTLCGTPSYVAPEILKSGNTRKYTKAVDIWSLGVVLYICLCGFPPFSDELCTPENPYKLSQQIKTGRFDYPSPYWDSVGDPALDLIDRMLTVEPEKRITVGQCLEHPWMTGKVPTTATAEKQQITKGIGNLNFSHRKIEQQRCLIRASWRFASKRMGSRMDFDL